jgi:multiple sugar transport system substrate-binding protein
VTALRGLTWDHPRGYRALEAAAAAWRADGGPDVTWDRQPLEGFESTPLADLARRYDLLVIDHPGLGAAAAADCLLPIDDLLSVDELAVAAGQSVGASDASYRLEGRQWAVPVDAAAQVSVGRADLLARQPLPDTWSEVLDLARVTPTALCLGGPHAFLTFSALCVAFGSEPARRDADRYVEPEAGSAVLELMRELAALADPVVSQGNPISVLDAMVAGDNVAYCPLLYGYVTYHQGAEAALVAADAPRWSPGGRRGSVLGGTGLAVSRHCVDIDAARAVAMGLASAAYQCGTAVGSGGQPSALAAWTDPVIDESSGGFYSTTLDTVSTAWVRPRYDGFVGFQSAASARLREALTSSEPGERVLGQVDSLFRAAAGQPMEVGR